MIGKGSPVLVPNEAIVEIKDMLHSSGFPSLITSIGKVFVKPKVNGRTYFGKQNKRITKRNDYTVSFKNSDTISFAIINHFLSIDDHSFAEIQHLNVEHTGPIRSLASDSITPSSQKVLFEDYFTCSIGRIEYILTEQIVT